MAERRMISKEIINSDNFLYMPASARALYFQLLINADDDGFIDNLKTMMQVSSSKSDDINILIEKDYLITFESGVVVIKDWKIHNSIRKDRKKSTKHTEELSLLGEKENGSYFLKTELSSTGEGKKETKRQKAYKESSLPYSFDYKIKNAFWGKECPICSVKMQYHSLEIGAEIRDFIPSIQHNIPISKGGKHELGNISVVCKRCNLSIQDKETDELNANEVIQIWDEISKKNNCQPSDNQDSTSCPHSIGKVRLGKVSCDEASAHAREENFTEGISPNCADSQYSAIINDTPNIYSAYENNIGSLNSTTAQVLKSWQNVFADDVIFLAIEESAKSNARSVRYLDTILRQWESANVKNRADATAQIEKFAKAKNTAFSKRKSKFDNYSSDAEMTDFEKKMLAKRMGGDIT